MSKGDIRRAVIRRIAEDRRIPRAAAAHQHDCLSIARKQALCQAEENDVIITHLEFQLDRFIHAVSERQLLLVAAGPLLACLILSVLTGHPFWMFMTAWYSYDLVRDVRKFLKDKP